jgi:hypothetical protein
MAAMLVPLGTLSTRRFINFEDGDVIGRKGLGGDRRCPDTKDHVC